MRGLFKKRNLGLLFFMISFYLLIFNYSFVQALGVRPMVIDLEIPPGASRDFEITLIPSDQEEVINLSFYKPVQLETGALIYEEVGPESYPVLNWIRLEEDRLLLPPGENRLVRGKVTVPFAAEGTHTVVIMVEPEVEGVSQGVTFKIRYAIRLNIKVDRPGLRHHGKLISVDFATEALASLQINAYFQNDSKLFYETTAEATIRNDQGRLVQRVELKTPVAWQSGSSSTTIYPGSQVLFTGNITEPLYPGDYELRLFFRYANGMQLIEKRELKIEEGIGIDQDFKAIRIQPETISVALRPGTASSQVIEIENISNEDVYLYVTGRDIEPDYPHSIYGNMEIQMRGEQEMLLAPYEKKRMVATIRAPRDLEAGSYYGYLDFVQLSGEDQVDLYSINLEAVSEGDKLVGEAEILSLYLNEDIFSLEIINKGKKHLYPTGRLVLRDEDGGIVKDLVLRLQEGMEKLLPGKSGLMLAIEKDLPAGVYKAEVDILENNQSIVEKEFTLEVK